MLKSSAQIAEDMALASKRMKSFYRECLYIIEEYDEEYIQASLKQSKSYVRTYIKRRKDSGDKKLYASEAKSVKDATLKDLII